MTASEAGYSGELAELTNLLVESEDLQSCLQRVADLAVRAVPVCQGVGVVVADSAGARTLAATGDHVWAMAAYQYAENEGPGVEAIRYGEPRRIDDMVVETRWPGFSVMAAEQGLRSTLALPLRMAGPASGALTWYAQTPHAFDGASHDLAVLFALRGGLALSNSDPYFASQRLIQNLHEALATRAVIEQAKGVLMARPARNAPRIRPSTSWSACPSERTERSGRWRPAWSPTPPVPAPARAEPPKRSAVSPQSRSGIASKERRLHPHQQPCWRWDRGPVMHPEIDCTDGRPTWPVT